MTTDLIAFRVMYAKTTPGQWVESHDGGSVFSWVSNDETVPVCGAEKDNAVFITAVHNQMPAILDEIECLRKEAANLKTISVAFELPHGPPLMNEILLQKLREKNAEVETLRAEVARLSGKVDVDPVKDFLALAERWKAQSNETTLEWKANDGSTSFRMGPPREKRAKRDKR